MKVKSKQKSFSWLILIYTIFVGQYVESYIAYSAAVSPLSYFNNFMIIVLLIGLPFISAPVQASLSDLYCRKKSLIVAILVTVIGLGIYTLGLFSVSLKTMIPAICLIGLGGNINPVSWAGLADLQKGLKLRFYIAISIFGLATGSWGSLIVAPELSKAALLATALVLALTALFLVPFFIDKEDFNRVEHDPAKGKIKAIFHEIFIENKKILSRPFNSLGFWSFFFSEISFYIILWKIILKPTYLLQFYPVAIAIGYTIGTFTIKKFRDNNAEVGSYGVVASLISIGCMAVLSFLKLFSSHDFHVMEAISISLFYAFYSFGYSIFTPSLFSLLIPKNHPHETGKIFGLIESIDAVANILSYLLIALVLISFSVNYVFYLAFIFLLVAYYFFKKTVSIHFKDMSDY